MLKFGGGYPDRAVGHCTGKRRRRMSTPQQQHHKAAFFDAANSGARDARERIAMETLDALFA